MGRLVLTFLSIYRIVSATIQPGPCNDSSECLSPDVCTTEMNCVCPLPNVGVVGESCGPCTCDKPNECCASDGSCKCENGFIRDLNGDCSQCPDCGENEVCSIPTDTGVPTCMCGEGTFRVGESCLGCPTCGIGEVCAIKPSGPRCMCREGRWRVEPGKCLKEKKPWKLWKPRGRTTCENCGKSWSSDKVWGEKSWNSWACKNCGTSKSWGSRSLWGDFLKDDWFLW